MFGGAFLLCGVLPLSLSFVFPIYPSLHLQVCGPGVPIKQIGEVCAAVAQKHKLTVVRDFIGHGVGTVFHAEPQVLHHRNTAPGTMQVCQAGMAAQRRAAAWSMGAPGPKGCPWHARCRALAGRITFKGAAIAKIALNTATNRATAGTPALVEQQQQETPLRCHMTRQCCWLLAVCHRLQLP